MRVRVVDAKAWYAGLAFACIGIVAFAMSHQYPIGTPLRMGPGYFPALMGVVLFALGVVSAIQGLRAEHPNPIERHRLVPFILLVVGVIAFGQLIERAGLVVANAALMFFACFDRLRSHPLETVILYVALTLFSVLLFVYGLGMVMPVLGR